MTHRFRLLLLLAALAGCRQDASETAKAQGDDPAAGAVGDTVGAAWTGVEYEAPRLIPAMRAQLQALRDPDAGMSEGNVTGYKNMAGDLVHAMLTDLNQVGSGEADQVRMLGDSVVNLVGGGTGVPAGGPEQVTRSTELMERLIERYQEAMRAARP